MSLEESNGKKKNCENCEYYTQHYARTSQGTYFKINVGHCVCHVPIKERKGKKYPKPDDICTCFTVTEKIRIYKKNILPFRQNNGRGDIK